jgi:predicted nucleic acid-binding protein
MGVQSPKLFAEIENQSAWLIKEGSPQDVANTAWACATLSHQSPELFAEIEKRSAWLIKEGNPQNVANMAWACATMGLQSPKVFAEIEKQSAWLVEEGNSQNVANTVWACATMDVHSPKLIAEIEKRSAWLIKEGSPQAVANTAWAFATMGLQSPNLFAEIEKHSAWLVKEGNPQDVANTARACATMSVHSPKLFLEIEKHSTWLVKEGNPQDVAKTALAFATLGYRHSAVFFGSFCKIISEFIKEGNQQHIINVCYAFAILDLTGKYEKEFRQLWTVAVSFDFRMLTAEESSQLFQVYAFSQARGMGISKPPISCFEAGRIFLGDNNNQVSKSQKEVSSILHELEFAHDEEVSPWNDGEFCLAPPGMLAIDMASRKRRVAIEFDGPSHFLLEAGSVKVLQLQNGATRAKRRFLRRLGWKVVNIPYFGWDQAKGKEERKALLCEKLKITAKVD